MPAFEKKFLLWIEKHLILLAGIVLGILGAGLRLSLRSLYAEAASMTDNSFSMWSGFLTAAAGAFVCLKRSDGKKEVKALFVFAILLFSPAGIFSTVILGSFGDFAVAAALMALHFYGGRRFIIAYLFLALSCLLGVQGLFLLPVFVLLCIRDEEHSLLYFLLPLAAAGARIAAELCGADFMGTYLPEGLREGRLYAGFPSFWAFLNDRGPFAWEHYSYGTAAVCLVALAAFMVYFGRKSRKTDSLLLALCCGLFVTEFMTGLDPTAASVTLLIWLLLAEDARFIIPAILLEMIALFPLAAAVYGEEWLPLSTQWLSVLRFAVTLFLMYLAAKGKKKELDEKTKV